MQDIVINVQMKSPLPAQREPLYIAIALGRNGFLYRSLLQQSQRSLQLKTLLSVETLWCCLCCLSCRICEVLSMMLSSLCNILISATTSMGSRAVPSTEPAFFISVISLVLVALMLLPQLMAAKMPLQQQTVKRFVTSCCTH